ncbi:MAG: TlpA family protein disulfide reductase [bacterium]|nr:TlpA family protein disulfide reductase [bacterium]
MRPFALIVLLFALAAQGTPSLAGDSPESPYCFPPPNLRETIETFEPWTSPCTSPECWTAKIAEAEALLETHPDDLFAHRAYQDAARWSRDEPLREHLLARYEERLEKRPSDPAAHYLAGRVSAYKEKARFYERSIELEPEFPWGHINLASGSSRGENEEAEEQTRLGHLVEFMRLCPSRTMIALQFVRGLGDAAFWRERLQELRERVAAESEARRAPALSLLWTAEFRSLPPAEHPALRIRIAEDLRHLEALERRDDHNWWQSLKEGYELVGDAEGRRRAEAGILEATPCSHEAVRARMDRFEESHGRPGPQSSEADHRSLFSASDDWIKDCPDDLMLHLSRFGAVQKLESLENEQVLEEIDRVLGIWERNTTRARMGRSPYYQAAVLLLSRGLDLERAANLLEREKALRAENAQHSRRSPEEDDEVKRFRTAEESDLGLTMAVAQIRLGRLEAAAESLDAIEPLLAVLAAQSGDDKFLPAQLSARWWRLRGERSEALNRPLDALGFYLRAASFLPEQAPEVVGGGWMGEVLERSDLERRARDIWQATGGSPESWQGMVEAGAGEAPVIESGDVVPWKEVEEELVDLELAAIDGKTWRLSDLEGKVTLVNVWATWCGPCHAELPIIDRLFEQFRERDDLMVLTLNVDRNPGLVAPFLERMDYTFPTLLATDFIEEREGGFRIPDNWIIDTSGTIRYRQTGFAAELEQLWTEEVVRLMEALGDR